MPIDVEDLWLQAIDAQDDGDRDEMCRLSDDIIAAEPDHSEAWWMRANLELPAQGMPTLDAYALVVRLWNMILKTAEHGGEGVKSL